MKITLLKNIRSFDILTLLSAFIYGNVFAIQYSTLPWGFFIIFCIIFFIEMFNSVLYFLNTLKTSDKKKDTQSFWWIKSFSFFFNTIKRGFLFGFFIEAFKVGS